MTQYKLNNLPSDADKFIFDTNFLVYLHVPYPNVNKTQMEKYTSISNYLIENQKTVIIDVIVLNEYINIFMQKAINRFMAENATNTRYASLDPTQKHIKRSLPIYKETLGDIKLAIKNLINSYNIEWHTDGYDFVKNISNDTVFIELENMEFSDYIISMITEEKKVILITNDNDLISCSRIQTLTI